MIINIIYIHNCINHYYNNYDYNQNRNNKTSVIYHY